MRSPLCGSGSAAVCSCAAAIRGAPVGRNSVAWTAALLPRSDPGSKASSVSSQGFPLGSPLAAAIAASPRRYPRGTGPCQAHRGSSVSVGAGGRWYLRSASMSA
uniref:Putative secreted protein n=1 Tax=Ixodes ricinus TaxID=34613 RepID=A0A6B0UFT9_IXORI